MRRVKVGFPLISSLAMSTATAFPISLSAMSAVPTLMEDQTVRELSMSCSAPRAAGRLRRRRPYSTAPSSTAPTALCRNAAANGYYLLGQSVAVGDVNGDGIPDIIAGEPGVNNNTGAAFVIFGKTSGWPTTAQPLSSFLNGTNGVELDGPAPSWTGAGVAGPGDLNGAGIANVIVSHPMPAPAKVLMPGPSMCISARRKTGQQRRSTSATCRTI